MTGQQCCRIHPRWAAFALVAMAGLNPAGAETLDDAWRMAAERDAGLAATRSRSEAADAEARAARAERWPTLTLDGTYQRLNDAPSFSFPVNGGVFTSPELVDGDDYVMARARIAMPLFTGGRVSSGIESASQAARGAALAGESYAQDLRLEVAVAYADVLRARRAVRAAAATVASLGGHAEEVAVMVEREAVPRNDLLAARVTLADAEQGLLRARTGEAVAVAAYNRLLGEPMDRPVDLAEIDDQPVPETNIADMVEQAQANRAEIGSLDARARALAEQARSERAGTWPQVGLVADYQHLENQVLDEEDFYAVGVGVTWALFDSGRIRNRASALRSASRAAAHDRDNLQARVALEVRQAWLDAQEAAERVPLTREAVAQSEENLRVARELYGVGLATNTVVLDAEALRLRATGNFDNAVLDVAVSRFRLRRAMGTL